MGGLLNKVSHIFYRFINAQVTHIFEFYFKF